MKTRILVAAAGLQVLVLAYMAGEREWVLHTGRTVYLRTAPVDPRDVMRGDYVRLNYEIGTVSPEWFRDGLRRTNISRPILPQDTKVYASLKLDEQDIAQLVSVSDRPPEDGLFIRGRVNSISTWGLSVRYGLEAYFMQQGRALELETSRAVGDVRVPLEMEVALGRNGLAVLRGTRWTPLGIGLELDTRQELSTNRSMGQVLNRVVGAKLQLINTDTNKSVAVLMPEDGSTFDLVPDLRWTANSWRRAQTNFTAYVPRSTDLIVLEPKASHTIQLNLDDPAWYVVDQQGGEADQKPRPVWETRSSWSTRFRFEYRPPTREACRGLLHENVIWHGRLVSRSFNAGGIVD